MSARYTAACDLIAKLAEMYPAAFFVYEKRRRPLKLGTYNDILAAHPEIEPATLSVALRLYTSNTGYLKACKPGADRIDLNGAPSGSVTAEQAESAVARLKDRKKPKRWRVADAVLKTKDISTPLGVAATPPRRITLGHLRSAAARKADPKISPTTFADVLTTKLPTTQQP